MSAPPPPEATGTPGSTPVNAPVNAPGNTAQVHSEASEGATRRATGSTASVLPTRDALHSGWLLALVWLFTRALMMHSWAHSYTFIAGDPRYYDWALTQGHGIGERLREYPVPVVWLLQFIRWVGDGGSDHVVVSFAVAMGMADAGFTLALWQLARARRAAWYWTVFTFCMGPLLWFRFDVLPAVVVGGALLLLVRRPGASGALVGVGAALKLWPALVLLPLLHRDRTGRRRALGFAIAGGGLGVLSLLLAGPTRLVSPLTWQSDRGLQVESLPGSLLVLSDAFQTRDRWTINLSPYNAYEIFGPWVHPLLHVSSVLMVLAGLLAVGTGVRAWRRGRTSPFQASMAAVAIIAAFIVANKTLSPQYLFWLGAPLAVLVSQAQTPVRQARAVVLCSEGLVAAVLTQVVYPNHYSQLIFGAHPDASIALALVARNLLCLVITLQAGLWSLFPGRRDPDA